MAPKLPHLTSGQTVTLDTPLKYVSPNGYETELEVRLHKNYSGAYSLSTDIDISREQISESRELLGYHSDQEVLMAMRHRAAEHGLTIEPAHTDLGDDFSVTVTQDINHPATIGQAYKQFLQESKLSAIDEGSQAIPAPFLDLA